MTTAYRDAVLADSPGGYWRLDMVGAAANGQAVPDSSSNDHHGALVLSAEPGFAPYGAATMIETDAASRAMFVSHFPGGGHGSYNFHPQSTCYVSIPDHADFDAGDVTCECWYKPGDMDYYGGPANTDMTILGKSDAYRVGLIWGPVVFPPGGALGEVWFRFFFEVKLSDNSFARVTAGSLVPITSTPYHLVGIRQGTTLALYINTSLEASGSSPALATNSNSSPVVIGSTTFLSTTLATIDECAIYDHALTFDRIQAHYEAAKLSLPAYFTSTTRVSLDIDTDAVIPVDFPFSHNWAQAVGGSPVSVRETLSWRTNTIQSEPDYQQRINAQPHTAERSLDYSVTVTAIQRARLRNALHVPGETYRIPIETDWMPLTSDALAGANTLELDTTLRDFEVGSYCVAVPDPYDPTSYQFFQIAALTDTDITTVEDVGDELPEGAPVYACRLAVLPDEDLSPESHSADRETWRLNFKILSTEISTRRVTAYTPAATYRGLEIFDRSVVKVEWLDAKSYQFGRRFEGTGNNSGDDYYRALDTGSSGLIPAAVTLVARAELSAYYGWLEARQGKQNPLWVISEERDFEKTARVSGTVIKVLASDYERTFTTGRRDLAFLKSDGTLFYRRVAAVQDNGDGTESLTVDSTVSLSDYNAVTRISFLKYCTLSSDEISLDFHRDLGTPGNFIVESGFALREMLYSPE